MTPDEVLSLLHQRGAMLEVDRDRLRVRPSQVLDDELRAAITQHKPVLLGLVADGEAEVSWRAAIMREQVRGRTSLPFLVVRRDFRDVPGVCMSCDGPLDHGRPICCTFCARAAKLVADEFLEILRQARLSEQAVGS